MRTTFLVLLAVVLTGCGKEVNSDYAAFRGDSVNGVRVFIDFLKSRENRVGVSRDFKPAMFYSADVLVHFSEGYQWSSEVQNWLRVWLEDEPDRDLILVLRGYDAEVDYWNDALAKNPDGYTDQQRQSISSQLDEAKARETHYTRSEINLNDEAWYGSQPVKQVVEIDTLEMEEEWAEHFEQLDGFRRRLYRQLLLPEDAEPVVWSGDHVLVARQYIGDSTLWIVADGSFLFNYSLISHQNRRLAAAFADALGPDRSIVFVREARIGEDEAPSAPTLWRFLTISPINWIAGHVFVALLAYILYRVAIFGRPREISHRECYRFGRHVEALGKLLQATRDVSFAQSRIAAYKRHKSTTKDDLTHAPETK